MDNKEKISLTDWIEGLFGMAAGAVILALYIGLPILFIIALVKFVL